jgi:CheY-like chemotaxis protein
MENMAAFWMCELAPTEIAGTDACNHNQFARPQPLTHDRASKVGRVSAGRRVLRVLVVDDEQNATGGLVRLVSRWGHAKRSAFAGATGLEAAADQHPDVVLLEIAMPFRDGCQVARQLRLDFPGKECFLIAVTERVTDQRRRQCRAAGIDLVLIKPVDPSVVETLLMLEYARVNRSRAGNTARFAVNGWPRFARRKPSADERAWCR